MTRSHLETPDTKDGQKQQRDVRNGVEDGGGQDQHVDVHATTGGVRVPNLLPWDARKDLDQGICEVECGVEPEQQMDENERPALGIRRKDAEIEKEDGEFRDKDQRPVHDLRCICELANR